MSELTGVADPAIRNVALAVAGGPLLNIALAAGIRLALGAYVVFMSRKFYLDPMGYFRRVARGGDSLLPDYPGIRRMVRMLAVFCLWGGCFIIASAIAAQILDLHGLGYAAILVLLSVLAAYLLLPDLRRPSTSEVGSRVSRDRDPQDEV